MKKIIKRVTGFVHRGQPMVFIVTNRSLEIRPLKVFDEEVRRGEFKYKKRPAAKRAIH